jgi:chaperonin GroES
MTKISIKPLGTRVLIEPMEAEQKTVGGIIIPDSAQEKPQRGTIVSAGQGTADEKMELKVGDKVLYGKYSGTELEFEGNKYLIMSQSDVLAII